MLWAPEVSLSTNDDRFCLWLLQRVSSCSLGFAIALGSFTSSPFEARLGLGSVSLIDMDDKTFDVCSGFTFFCEMRRTECDSNRKVCLSGNSLSCNCGSSRPEGLVLVLLLRFGFGVYGLADSAFAVDHLLFQFPFFSPLEHSPLSTPGKFLPFSSPFVEGTTGIEMSLTGPFSC